MRELIELDGIGSKTSKLFEKLDIYNDVDLITYYPKRYDILKRTDMNNIKDKDRVVIDGIVEGVPVVNQINFKLKKIMFRISNGIGIYNVCVYNQIYLLKELKVGIKVIVIGKFDRFKNVINGSDVRLGELPRNVVIEPVYRATDGLNKKVISKVIDSVLNSDIDIEDNIPKYFSNKYHFIDKLSAIREIHHPSNEINFKRAKQRLKYEEFFLYLAKIRYLKYLKNSVNTDKKKVFDSKLVDEFISSLSFELTVDQKRTIDEIRCDMLSVKQMNRLVQGDVGSGKTIVAFIASYMNYLSGYQSALMVPTEILAMQHYQSAIDLFKNTDIEIALFTSSLSSKKRKDILKRLNNGEIDFVIGTQSLIQEDVNYKNLGLIIADEQHRFGVNQRKILKSKGIVPDVLSMSATPIPRTYALTIYGDMDVSSIKTKPKGRKEISTLVKREKEILDVLKLMKEEIDKGHQVYVVAPAIENDDVDVLDNVIELKKKMELAFGKICEIGFLHGKLDNDEKSRVMERFESGDVKILISTTVIEVGVNVPNASMIVIFKANLFGLSTLHQLRGRVGRGSVKSYCVLLSKDPCDRLDIMEKTNDGFVISEFDFKNRGEGDLFGVRQSGEAEFKLADLKRDFDLLVRVKNDIDDFFDSEDISKIRFIG